MAIRFTTLTEANAPAVCELLAFFWNQDAGSPFVRELFEWRYFARPSGQTLLAFDGDRCVGIIDALFRRYLKDDRLVSVRETCDWFCLPDYRPLGVGAVLMRRLMAQPEPIISVGGSKATLALLPRLKWQYIGEVDEYVLPRTARMLVAWGLRGIGRSTGKAARWVPAVLPFRSLRGVQSRTPGMHVEPIPDERCVSFPRPDGGALSELLDDSDRAWLAEAPSRLGELIGLQFSIDGKPVGISLGRVEPYAPGRIGKILHLQVAMCPPGTIDWIIAETAQRLVERGAEMLVCRASCPKIGRALRHLGFFCLQDRAAFWWPGTGGRVTGSIDLTYLRADDALPFDELARSNKPSARLRTPAGHVAGRYTLTAGTARGATMAGSDALAERQTDARIPVLER
jgi:hypothetical protein